MRHRRWIFWSLANILAACGPPRDPIAQDTKDARVNAVVEEQTDPSSVPASQSSTFFSGEIVYRREAIENGSGKRASLPDLHYFISGAHWKMVVADRVTALYDPNENLVRYFDPPSVVDAAIPDGTVRFEHVAETKVVLGHTCRGMRVIAEKVSFLEFYAPDLRVDPSSFANHHHGHWAETLLQKRGALALWSSVEGPGFSTTSEAIRIEKRTFGAEFWTVP